MFYPKCYNTTLWVITNTSTKHLHGWTIMSTWSVIQSFSLSYSFILVTVMVDLEFFTGTLGIRMEYVLDGTPVLFDFPNSPTSMFVVRWREPENPEQSYTGRICNTSSGWIRGLGAVSCGLGISIIRDNIWQCEVRKNPEWPKYKEVATL